MQPETRYVRSGDLQIAYQVIGDGPLNLVFVPGTISHLDLLWTHPGWVNFASRLARFSRVAFFDKRGTGLSDPTPGPATLDERLDDVRAVMDAAGMDVAALFGFSEGSPLAILFAATYPERTRALVLTGAFAYVDRTDRRLALLRDAFENWGEGRLAALLAPSLSTNPVSRRLLGTFERASASPKMALALFESNLMIDVRPILRAVRVPTIVLHRQNEFLHQSYPRAIADEIPGARFVLLDGNDHAPFVGDVDALVDEVETFLTGALHRSGPDRTVATVLFTDIVGSTERNAEEGDSAWRQRLDQHTTIVREALGEFSGREVKSMGDGVLAAFDGPARALRCAEAIVQRVRAIGLDMKAGVHTGEVELYEDGDLGGMAVNIGARVVALATSGEVLVSSTVKDLLIGSGFRFVPRGTRALKGVPGEWALFALAGASAHSGALTPPAEGMSGLDRAVVRVAKRAPRASRALAKVLARERRNEAPSWT